LNGADFPKDEDKTLVIGKDIELPKDKSSVYCNKNGVPIKDKKGVPMKNADGAYLDYAGDVRDKDGNILANKDGTIGRNKNGILEDKDG
jgi:hypothetical protein